MAEPWGVDPALFPSLAEYYQRQRVDLNKTKTYVVQHCTLDNAMGLLLSHLQPTYNDARDRMFAAVDSADQVIGGLAEQMTGYEVDVTEGEIVRADEFREILSRIEALENAEGGGGGSGNGGGYGGGGSAPMPAMPTMPAVPDPVMPSIPDPELATAPEVVPEPELEPEPDPDPVPIVNIDVDVTINSGSVTVVAGDGSTVIVGDANTIIADPELFAAREAEQNAREAAFYEQLWEERAGADPLGRSAEELRLAWESREPVPLKEVPAGESALGYAGQSTASQPIRFEIYLPDQVPSADPIGATV